MPDRLRPDFAQPASSGRQGFGGQEAGVMRVVQPTNGRVDVIRTLLEKGYTVSCVRDAADDPAISASDLVERLDHQREAHGVARGGSWKPWFPVIDYQRCTNCMQCLSFCLFDVYGVSPDNKIQVQNQSNCKTECPACSRVCPEVAIMFPKYRHGPINGDVVNADDVRREAMKVDISALLGGDVYSMLRDRSAKAKSRFSKERDDQRALEERQNCLVKLRQSIDIPAEVLAALPTPDEILAKAEAARARAEAARAAIALSTEQAVPTNKRGERERAVAGAGGGGSPERAAPAQTRQ